MQQSYLLKLYIKLPCAEKNLGTHFIRLFFSIITCGTSGPYGQLLRFGKVKYIFGPSSKKHLKERVTRKFLTAVLKKMFGLCIIKHYFDRKNFTPKLPIFPSKLPYIRTCSNGLRTGISIFFAFCCIFILLLQESD